MLGYRYQNQCACISIDDSKIKRLRTRKMRKYKLVCTVLLYANFSREELHSLFKFQVRKPSLCIRFTSVFEGLKVH